MRRKRLLGNPQPLRNAALRFYADRKPTRAEIGLADLHALACEGDDDAVAALTQQTKQIGRGLRMVTALLSPEVIFIAGEITQAWAIVGPVIEAELNRTLLTGSPPRLVPSEEGSLARLRGASALVL